jgi:SAM-dependent methyltransferase
LSADEVKKGDYKKYLGGGKETWESRGQFQLYFLKKMGLLPAHRLLDAGCGPLRAGIHFVEYLEPGHYAGFDYNLDFITTARQVVAENPVLSARQPVVEQVSDFDFSRIPGTFDFVLAFSVLNHCDDRSKGLFFQRLPTSLRAGSKVYITHARWLDAFPIPGNELKITRILRGPEEIEPGLDMQQWGWPPDESIFPVIELMPAGSPS